MLYYIFLIFIINNIFFLKKYFFKKKINNLKNITILFKRKNLIIYIFFLIKFNNFLILKKINDDFLFFKKIKLKFFKETSNFKKNIKILNLNFNFINNKNK